MTSPDKVRRIKNVLSDIEKVCGNCMYNGEPNGCNRIGGVCEMYDAVWDALDYIKELEKRVADLEAKVPKWVNPKEKLPKVPKGFKFIEVLCLYDHDGWKHCELLRFYDKKDEEFKFEPGWHQLDMFDPIMDYEDGMIGWMYLPGFPVPPEEEEA